MERQNAERQQRIAVEQRQSAEAERQRAERLLLLSIANSLANESIKLHQRDDRTKLAALLGLQAYQFHNRNGGSALDPNVYNALFHSNRALGLQERHLLRGHEDEVRAVLFDQIDGRVISAAADGSVRLWSDGSGTGDQVLYVGGEPMRALVQTAPFLAAADMSGAVWLWNLEKMEAAPRKFDVAEREPSSGIISLALDRSGDRLAAGTLDGNIRVWSVGDRGVKSPLLRSEGGRAYALAFSPDGRWLAGGGEDGQVFLFDGWDGDRAPSRILTGGNGKIGALRFDRQGQRLAAGLADGDIVVWDWRDAEIAPEILTGHTASVTSIDFSPDDSLLCSSSLDRSVRVWDVEAPENVPLLLESDAWVWAAGFSGDGNRIVAGGADKNVRIWTIRTEILAAEICGRVGRNLDPAEWTRYIGPNTAYEKTCPGIAAESREYKGD